MAFAYAPFAEVATRQIADKGRIVRVLYKTAGSYDPETDTLYRPRIRPATVRALVTDYRAGEVDGTLIQMGDKKVLCAAEGLTKPAPGDIVEDGSEYRVVAVQEVGPGDTPILYKLQVRK